MFEIIFHQQIISPHVAAIAQALAALGHDVTYTATRYTRSDRTQLGWSIPDLGAVKVKILPNAEAIRGFLDSTPNSSLHICEGLRGNGFVGEVQRQLRCRGIRYWVRMETLDGRGLTGRLRELLYGLLFLRYKRDICGILAIGKQTTKWIVERGVDAAIVYPFTYFLDSREHQDLEWPDSPRFRFLFVGALIPRKRVGLLIDALSTLGPDVELFVVGMGPLEKDLREKAREKLGDRAVFLGSRPMGEIHKMMAKADCLVLPSWHDGWGVVVSEALMVGTPAVCSNACGATEAVEASGVGGVFESGSFSDFVRCLEEVYSKGRLSLEEREALAMWARAFSGTAGAMYLSEILDHRCDDRRSPLPPWRRPRISAMYDQGPEL